MIDELQMKRLEKRLDELEFLALEYSTNGKHIPEEIRKEYKELSHEYNEMVSETIQDKKEDFLNSIKEEL